MKNNKIYDESIFQSHDDYKKSYISEKELDISPFIQFEKWFNEVLCKKEINVNAMSLSTVNSQGIPSSRIVLLKDFNDNGFTFYTNYNSHKGQDLQKNPNACLLFFWQLNEKQIRIEGSVMKTTSHESDNYYNSRPIDSRIGAWASKQSEKTTHEELQSRIIYFQKKYKDNPPRPENWGGFILKPKYFEFWQGRPSRLHDRFSYTKDNENTDSWIINRLFP